MLIIGWPMFRAFMKRKLTNCVIKAAHNLMAALRLVVKAGGVGMF